MKQNFAITGVAGYVAPRHLAAIRDTGNRLTAAIDPHDAAGILDHYSFDVRFFTEIERFDRYLEKLRRGPEENRVHYVSICSPNYLHDAHCRLALRVGANAICEKPLVLNSWNLDALQELESEYHRRVYTVLQLRLHPMLMELRDRLHKTTSARPLEVCLTYITPRGRWYDVSWKGAQEKSGGIAANIGIHFFDILLWLFGPVAGSRLHHASARRMSGFLELERARVKWFLSVEPQDMPSEALTNGLSTYRSITVDGAELEFTNGFASLHTRLYEEILAGRGFGIEEARPSVELAQKIRNSSVVPVCSDSHHLIARG